jgi:hypothetical protein
MWYSILADVIVAAHLAYVSYVLVGQVLIVLGWILKWGWVRNLWFRVTHLAMILVVAIESIFQIECPMTTWEYDLRSLAQQEATEGSFIGRLLGDILFYDAPADHPAFLAAYVGFALLVLATFVFVPPRTEGYRRSSVVAIVLGLVGTMFVLFIEPRWIGLTIAACGLLSWALGARAEAQARREPPLTA